MQSYNTFKNPYKKHLTSEEVLEKRLQNLNQNWLQYVKLFLILQIGFLVFVFSTVVVVRLALLVF